MIRFNLSPQQQRIWLLTEARGPLNTQCGLELNGPFDLDAFTGLVRELYANHEILRTTYATHEKNRFPHQLVYEAYEPDVRYLDLAQLPPEARAARREEIYR